VLVLRSKHFSAFSEFRPLCRRVVRGEGSCGGGRTSAVLIHGYVRHGAERVALHRGAVCA
jgi:hypothetical protein